MVAEETRHDLLLKRIQITIAILAGLATLILGVYNINKTFFAKPEPAPAAVPVAPTVHEPKPGDQLRGALEEAGASWIKKKLGSSESTSK